MALFVRKLGESEFVEAAVLMAEAFIADNKLYDYIFKDSSKINKLQHYRLFFLVRLSIIAAAGGSSYGLFEGQNDLPNEEVFVSQHESSSKNAPTAFADDAHSLINKREKRLLSTMTLSPIEAQTPSVCTMLSNGLLRWLCQIGYRSLLRAIDIGDQATEYSKSVNGTCDMEVMLVATLTSFQKKGLGSILLRTVLTEAALKLSKRRRGSDTITIGLSTQLERNCRFYQKFNFAITGSHIYFPGTSDELNSWSMRLTLSPDDLAG